MLRTSLTAIALLVATVSPVAGESRNTPTIEEKRVVLDERLLFDAGAARLAPAAKSTLGKLAWKMYLEAPWKRIRVEGHSDASGDPAVNRALSQLRAERVRAQLIRQGFDPACIEAVGYGSERPLETGTSPESRRKNRRVELVLER